MSKLYDFLSKNPFFITITGLASLISLFVSITNDTFVLWSILAISIFMLITLIILVQQNSRMFRRLDDLNCDIFNQNVDLEISENDEKYISQLPIIIVMTSFLTPETASKKPIVEVQIDFPPQLNLDFNFSNENITRQEFNSNSIKFKVTLKSEATIITIRSLSLSREEVSDFERTSRKINIVFESDLFPQPKKESLLVSV
ncbi:hypothetical protein [Bacillus sp. TE8-1]|uniref:hypothetical protein n=1 Tax=Bacillus sp. TE8-1 TaxID=2217829 RepID=UPI0011F03844|nr:hypothetical protein [Bacillus sp. TE8-1]KAA0761718.1 hypothetical protein DN404_25185 [Bacillus sp. TE8-1]